MADEEPDVVALWERLLRFQRASVAEMDRNLRDQFGHSLDDYDILHQVATHDGPIRMGDLAENLLVANSSCNRLVARLVDSGHLRRRPGQRDRREILVELTAAGRRLHRRLAVAHTRDIHRLVGAAPDDLRALATPPESVSR